MQGHQQSNRNCFAFSDSQRIFKPPTSAHRHSTDIHLIQRAFDMLFVELCSILYPIMAETFANLSKQERIEKAVAGCIQDSKLSATKAAKIYNIAPSTITRRLNEQTNPKKLVDEDKQLAPYACGRAYACEIGHSTINRGYHLLLSKFDNLHSKSLLAKTLNRRAASLLYPKDGIESNSSVILNSNEFLPATLIEHELLQPISE
jgi:helix-turn-helix, Psq domain